MALPFPSFPWLWKSPLLNPNPSPNPSPQPPPSSFPSPIPNSNFTVHSSDSFAALDVDPTFQISRNTREKQPSGHKVYGNARRRGPRRRNQSLDLDFDMVIVQAPDYFSGSESEGSDWSVGWFEPHAAEFCSDGEPENSFAVLVPCYGSPAPDSFCGKARFGHEDTISPLHSTNTKSQLWAAVLSNLAKDSHAVTNSKIEASTPVSQPVSCFQCLLARTFSDVGSIISDIVQPVPVCAVIGYDVYAFCVSQMCQTTILRKRCSFSSWLFLKDLSNDLICK